MWSGVVWWGVANRDMWCRVAGFDVWSGVIWCGVAKCDVVELGIMNGMALIGWGVCWCVTRCNVWQSIDYLETFDKFLRRGRFSKENRKRDESLS